MNTNKFSRNAVVLMAIILLGTFMPRLSAVKNIKDNLSFDPEPYLWCVLVLIIHFLLPRMHVPGRLRLKGQVYGIAFTGAVILLALRFGVGVFMQCIAVSPYDLSLSGMFINLTNLFPALVAHEMVRAYALGEVSRNSNDSKVWILVITLVICLPEINYSKIMILKSTEEWFVYIAKDILPLITQSWLLTSLVLFGGATAGVIYAGSIAAFTRLFPLLPSLSWIAESAIGIVFPIIAALFLWEWYGIATHKQIHQKQNLELFTVELIFTVAFAWFLIGVFPIYPSVILTGSMEPEIYPGDIVIIQKFSNEDEIYALTENDMINFKRDNITINHRIIGVLYDPEGNISFQTKGDNNKSADQIAVMPADLNGIIKWVIPKAGLPILWLQGSEPLPEGVLDVEYN